MLFTDDEIVINQTRKAMNENLKLWRGPLSLAGKRLVDLRQFVECKFSVSKIEEVEMVKIENKLVPGCNNSAAYKLW